MIDELRQQLDEANSEWDKDEDSESPKWDIEKNQRTVKGSVNDKD